MKLLFDVGHPSFVYLFKNCASYFLNKGDEVRFTARDKDITLHLLQSFGFSYKSLGANSQSILGKILSLIKFDYRLLREVKKFKPNVIISGASPYAAHVAAITGVPHFLFDDTQNKEQLLLYKYCAQTVLTPKSFTFNAGKQHIRYPGYHELAYLHPKWFKPVQEIRNVAKEPLILVRFISHKASHDAFISCMDDNQKIYLVNELLQHGKVIISSEVKLPSAIQKYSYKGAAEDIHSIIQNASLVIGESATMAAEAAILGVPAVFFDENGRCYTNEIEQKYGLIYTYASSQEDIEQGLLKAISLLSADKKIIKKAQTKLIKENIDLSAFIIWMLEHQGEFKAMDEEQKQAQIKTFIDA